MEKLIKEAAQLLYNSEMTLALTGAGISVESGIPDFRSAQGLWSKYDPNEYATITAFRAAPEKVWAMLRIWEIWWIKQSRTRRMSAWESWKIWDFFTPSSPKM